MDRICGVTECLIDDEDGGFRSGKGCVDPIFNLKQIGEKAYEIKPRMHVSFIYLACIRVKGDENEYFRIDRGVRKGCVMSPWLFNICIWMKQ